MKKQFVILSITVLHLFIISCEKENNAPPVIDQFSATLIKNYGTTGDALIEYSVTDPDGDELSIIFKEMRNYVDERELGSTNGAFEIGVINSMPYFFQLVVTDSHGNSVQGQISFSFQPQIH